MRKTDKIGAKTDLEQFVKLCCSSRNACGGVLTDIMKDYVKDSGQDPIKEQRMNSNDYNSLWYLYSSQNR